MRVNEWVSCHRICGPFLSVCVDLFVSLSVSSAQSAQRAPHPLIRCAESERACWHPLAALSQWHNGSGVQSVHTSTRSSSLESSTRRNQHERNWTNGVRCSESLLLTVVRDGG